MESELTISVYKFLGTDYPQGRSSEDGSPSAETLRNHILDNWDKYEKLNVSLDSIVKMTRTFVDEAFAKIMETRSLEEFNNKVYFPDAKEAMVKELNNAVKLRLKIISSKKERERDELSI